MVPSKKGRLSDLAASVRRTIIKKGISLSKRLSFNKDDIAKQLGSYFGIKQQVSAHSGVELRDLPLEMKYKIFDELPLQSLSCMAMSSKEFMDQIKIYFLSAHFKKRILKEVNASELESCLYLPVSCSEDRVDFTLLFFQNHYYQTALCFDWSIFLYRIQTMLPSEEMRTYFQIKLLELLKSSARELISCSTTQNQMQSTVDAFRLIFHTLVSREHLAVVLTVALKWFSRSNERALFMLKIFCNCDPTIFEREDVSFLTDAQRYLSEIAQALQCLCEHQQNLKEGLTEIQLFHLVEAITTYPSPWLLRNFVVLLLFAPNVFRIICNIRFRMVSWEELNDIVFEVLCSFAEWDQCYLMSFMFILKDFIHFSDVYPVKHAVLHFNNCIWQKFSSFYMDRPFLDSQIYHVMNRMQMMIFMLLTP